MMRILLALLALASVFLFPYPLTLVLSFTAGVFLPAVPLLAGILTDLYYHTPGASLVPYGTVAGALLAIACVLVRRFIKARIID